MHFCCHDCHAEAVTCPARVVCWHIVGIDDWNCYELLLDVQNESAISIGRGKGQDFMRCSGSRAKLLEVFHYYNCVGQILNINAKSCLHQKALKAKICIRC